MTPERGARRARRPPRRPGLGARPGLALSRGERRGAGEQWGWLGVRIRDLTEQETEELSEAPRHPRGLRRADRPGHEGHAGRGGGTARRRPGGRRSTGGRSSRREPSSAWWAPRRPGREIALVVLREQDRQELRVRVGRMPPEVVADRLTFEFGFFVRDVAEERAAALPGAAGRRWWRASPSGAPPRAGGCAPATGSWRSTTSRSRRSKPSASRTQDLILRDAMRLRVEREGEPLTLTLPPAQPSSR